MCVWGQVHGAKLLGSTKSWLQHRPSSSPRGRAGSRSSQARRATAVALTMYTLSPHPINVMSQPDNNVMMIKMILIEIANGGHYHYG